MNDPPTGPFYLLGDPWIHSRDRGKTTTVLYGSPDPHVATVVADTTCITGCGRCEKDSLVHRRDAEWLVKALNFAANHNADDGCGDEPGLPLPGTDTGEEDSEEPGPYTCATCGVDPCDCPPPTYELERDTATGR